MQLTNCQMGGYLISGCSVGIRISTTIPGGGFHAFDSAIILPDGGIEVGWSGRYARHLGPGFRSEANDSASVATAFKMSGVDLAATVVKFDRIDAVRIKTLFDIDGSVGGEENDLRPHLRHRAERHERDRVQAHQRHRGRGRRDADRRRHRLLNRLRPDRHLAGLG
jgi:hypothetical protein